MASEHYCAAPLNYNLITSIHAAAPAVCCMLAARKFASYITSPQDEQQTNNLFGV